MNIHQNNLTFGQENFHKLLIMQDAARFFAYSTWALMISVAIVIFSHLFFGFMSESVWAAVIIALGFGFLYFNFTFAAIKRFIRKIPAPTNSHILLAILIFLPPAIWILTINQTFTQNDLLLILALILSTVLGVIYGNRAGIKARYEYIQKLKERQQNG